MAYWMEDLRVWHQPLVLYVLSEVNGGKRGVLGTVGDPVCRGEMHLVHSLTAPPLGLFPCG